MSDLRTLITLSIQAVEGDPPSLMVHVRVGDEVVMSNRTLAPEKAQEIQDFSRRFNERFERRYRRRVEEEVLQALGADLFAFWLGDVWEKVAERIPSGSRRWLVVASDVPDVLNLPWELVRPPRGEFLGIDARFSIRRFPRIDRLLPDFEGALPPRPLRILFVACAPQDQHPLDYDREEERLVEAIGKGRKRVAFDSCDLGTFDELRECIDIFQPHVVHMNGHGIVRDGLGHFCFEDERGQTDLRSSREMSQGLFAGTGVQCVFVSGCQTGKAPPIAALGGICQGLVGEEVPMAIGWAASIADDVAMKFAETFYRTLASGQPIEWALKRARQDIRRMCKERGDPSWTLPVLYTATTQNLVFDPDPNRPPEQPTRPVVKLRPLPGMTEGYAAHFVGRRRETQRLLPALRDGTLNGVLITGLGGMGKSTLATRLARKLEADDFRLIPVPSAKDKPLSVARLLNAFGDAFLKAKLDDDYATLQNPEIPEDARLRYAVNVLNEHPFLLVLDNFESNLDEPTRTILDPALAAFVVHLVENLTEDSRFLLTSRYRPAELDNLPSTVKEESLEDFPEAVFIKFLLRDEVVEQRYNAGDLPFDLLTRLHDLLGGTPRFLGQIREVLRTMKAEELRDELDAVTLPEEGIKSVLREKRDAYCETIFTARLYASLPPESQKALSKAAVYSVPMTLEGFAAVAEAPVETLHEFARTWQDRALAYPEQEQPDAQPLWSLYGLLRSWLLEKLTPEERHSAHEAGGDFLMKLREEKREAEAGLTFVEADMEARALFLAAGTHEKARNVTNRLSEYLIRQGVYEAVVSLNEELLDYETHPGPMRWIGRAYSDQSKYDEARTWFGRGLKEAEDTNPDETAAAWHGLATVDLSQGLYEAAREKYERALAIQQQIRNRAGEASTWHQLATIDLNQDLYEAAREKLERALAISQQIGDRFLVAGMWHQLATIDLNQGSYEAAQENLKKSLEIKQQIGDRTGGAMTWHQLATIDVYQGSYEAATEKFEKNLEIFREIGDRVWEAKTWHNLASIDFAQGSYESAREKFEKSLEIDQQIGDRSGEAAAWHSLASIDLAQGSYESAREKFERVLAIRQQIGDRSGEAVTFGQLGVMAAEMERTEEGLRLHTLSAALFQSIGHANLQNAEAWVNNLASQLNYTQEQFEAMNQKVDEAYQQDRGWGLIRAAFGEEGEESGGA